MKDLVGQTLGQYRIEATLGYGGMGQVFRSKHVYLDRLAAVKVMHNHLVSHPTFRARFLQEARSTAALRNPHIVEIYEFGEQDGLLYLVMELITGGTLSTLLQSGAGQQRQAPRLLVGLDLIRQAAEGLDAAHALGMIHRDIKPDNLLLNRLSTSDRGGEQYQLKISDFGLARLSESSGLTTGGPVGTPAYMSPEQCQNRVLDRRSDLYSLGVVLYEVVTGSPPFQINNFSDAVQKHVHAVPLSPQQVRPDLPPVVEQIILRCLAKRPEERYQTGKELARALQGVINGTGLQTMTPLQPPVTSTAHRQTPQRQLHVYAASVANRTTDQQAQDGASTKRRRIPHWFFPGLAALLAVALILSIVIPRGSNPSGVSTSSISTPLVTSSSPALAGFNPAQFYNAVTSRPPLYNSALSSQDNANWDEGKQCSFVDGAYNVSALPGVDSGVTVCLGEFNFSNFAFQAQMTLLSGSGHTDGGGLVFRGTSATDQIYRWRVGPDGSYDVFHGNLVGPAGSATGAAVLNQPVLLTVIAQGNLIYLYVNKQFVSSAYSTFSTQGQIGFLAFAQDQPVDITFANTQIWQL